MTRSHALRGNATREALPQEQPPGGRASLKLVPRLSLGTRVSNVRADRLRGKK